MAQPGKLLKEQKLWGDHGQEALESAHVCLINATATGTEILKNLVLPGIGSFTVIDGNQVSGEDAGNNTLLRLADVLWNSQVPLLICRTYGLVGYMRIIIKEHPVIESHPDNALEDLRLDKPFPELREHFQSYDLDHMEKKTNGRIPKTYKEKEDFRDLIRQGILKNENGAPEDEENFEEAIKNVNTALNTTQIPSSIEDIFNDDRCINITKQTPTFWILARALKEFVAKEGQGNLPVRGTIPDMIADSGKYIKLQNVYREKAKKDAAAVGNHVAKLLQSIGQVVTYPDLKTLHPHTYYPLPFGVGEPWSKKEGLQGTTYVLQEFLQLLRSSILSEVSTRARSKLPSGKNILVFARRAQKGLETLAGQPESGQVHCARGEDGSGKTTLMTKLQGAEHGKKGRGLEYLYLSVHDEDRDDHTRCNVWILDGDLYHKGLLKFAVSAESLPETLVIFVADMSRPWTVMESLQKWASVLREHIDKMKIPPEEMRELERKFVKDFQDYIEPEEGCQGSPQRRGPLTSGPDEENVALPLGDNVLTHNLGIPVLVVCTKVCARELPAGWDNEKKIAILHENFTTVKPEDAYEDFIVKPPVRKLVHDKELAAEDEQVFLMKQQCKTYDLVVVNGAL
ncbi:hypothetical protein CB1_000490080 [Camelus ferus]|nr:hypothetical protein CB1_000490080 [Camelus ferus]